MICGTASFFLCPTEEWEVEKFKRTTLIYIYIPHWEPYFILVSEIIIMVPIIYPDWELLLTAGGSKKRQIEAAGKTWLRSRLVPDYCTNEEVAHFLT
jgi:hypothetical protein